MSALLIVLLVLLSMCSCIILVKKTTAMSQNYDVFLSFRGEDTRKRFTDFLYISLADAGFHVFRDDNALSFGKEIGPELLRAIRNCRIAIPIISEQYAQSKSCLQELNEIMNCHAKQRTSVFPLFYKVNGVDVLEHRGNFGEALRKHAKHCSVKEVQDWKSALTSVAKIKGWTSETIANGNEGELVDMVVAKVSSVLKAAWIERLPFFPTLMSYYQIRSVYLYFTEKGRSEVFLAFHGADTGCGFAAYLYSRLVHKRIRVFNFDDPSLIGKDVSVEIRNAIDNCKIFIPILSENFASSSWCLDQLAQMVCKKAKGQEMLPIFYKVKPSDVEHLLQSFGDDMRRQKRLFKTRTYEWWKEALREVGSSKGWESEKIADGHEGELAKQVVEKVLGLLKNPQTHDRPIHMH